MNSSKQICHGAVRRLDLGRQCRLWLLALASMVFLHASAWAEIAANTSFVSGVVTATASAKPTRELAKGHDIFSGDTIDTADNGRIQMRFTDGGLVSLMPRTTFSVDEYLHEGKPAEEGSLVFGMLRGGMRTITGSIGKIKHDQYELKTPVATLGIRGTEYIAVLNPPNTLRVHVGKGKVVITNDQGTLEVPEGRNAVVTLGSAPEFSDQGPQYLAAGIGGDRASLEGLIDQDPYGVDVTLDTPWVFDEERRLASNPPAGVTTPPPGGGTTPPGGGTTPPGGGTTPPGGGTTPPGGGTTPPGGGTTPPGGGTTPPPPMADGPGYQMLGFGFDPVLLAPTFFEVNLPVDTTVEFDQTTGELLAYTGEQDLNIGTLRSVNFDTLDHNITWGEFTDGTGVLDGDPVTLSSTQFLPYVVGVAVQNLPAGTLTYELAGATDARNQFGDQGTLDSFNLDIDVGLGTYRFDMGLTMPAGNYTASSPAGSSLGSGYAQDGFSFSADNVTGSCVNSGCTLGVNGFLAGANAEQAGILYRLDDGNGTFTTGAAALTRP